METWQLEFEIKKTSIPYFSDRVPICSGEKEDAFGMIEVGEQQELFTRVCIFLHEFFISNSSVNNQGEIRDDVFEDGFTKSFPQKPYNCRNKRNSKHWKIVITDPSSRVNAVRVVKAQTNIGPKNTPSNLSFAAMVKQMVSRFQFNITKDTQTSGTQVDAAEIISSIDFAMEEKPDEVLNTRGDFNFREFAPTQPMLRQEGIMI